MSENRAIAAKNAPQSQKGREQNADSRVQDAWRKSGTLSPAMALQALRLGASLSPVQAAELSHTMGNRALEELLSVSGGPELLGRSLPSGDLRTPPLSMPDGAPEASVVTASPAWDETDGAPEASVVTASPAWDETDSVPEASVSTASPAWDETDSVPEASVSTASPAWDETDSVPETSVSTASPAWDEMEAE